VDIRAAAPRVESRENLPPSGVVAGGFQSDFSGLGVESSTYCRKMAGTGIRKGG
jgi:hypothetical protein